MIVKLQVRGLDFNVAKFGEALRSALRVNVEGPEALPEWLRQQFAPEAASDEKVRWLDEWRLESDEGKARMERERGWEMSNWVYWISGESGFWEIEDVVQEYGESLVIALKAVDWPVPVAALDWLAERLDVTIGEVGF